MCSCRTSISSRTAAAHSPKLATRVHNRAADAAWQTFPCIPCLVFAAAGARVALRNDSYALHILLPSKIDPLVSLMKVEKVPDSTYDMIGGCDQQIKEIKEVWRLAAILDLAGSL